MLKLLVSLVFALSLYGAAVLFLPGLLSHRRAKRHVESKRERDRD